MWLNHDGGLVFMGEDRSSSNGSLAAAIRDLERRMHAQWHPLTLGHLPFLLCYASCGLRVREAPSCGAPLGRCLSARN